WEATVRAVPRILSDEVYPLVMRVQSVNRVARAGMVYWDLESFPPTALQSEIIEVVRMRALADFREIAEQIERLDCRERDPERCEIDKRGARMVSQELPWSGMLANPYENGDSIVFTVTILNPISGSPFPYDGTPILVCRVAAIRAHRAGSPLDQEGVAIVLGPNTAGKVESLCKTRME
ncbi:MAG: hypothetical protein MUC67_08520, partial [Acidobacteria bacterium]|nr:hypothetical protein [Acidobacteriota bacterium]